MTEHLAPGVYVEEVPVGAHPIEGVSTSTAGFIGLAPHPHVSGLLTSFTDFLQAGGSTSNGYLSAAVKGFFDNGGGRCYVAWIAATDPIAAGLTALAEQPISMLCCPDEHVLAGAAVAMAAHCERQSDCICILQSPQPVVEIPSHRPPVSSSYATYYCPWVLETGGARAPVPPCGHVAGLFARTDVERGVWTAPTNRPIRGVTRLAQDIDGLDVDVLTNRGVSVLRNLPGRGIVAWNARITNVDTEWNYVNVRRLFVFVEESLQRGLQWAVFERPGSLIWATVRAEIESFLLGLWRNGALMGQKPDEAYSVRCDLSTMTQNDVDSGRLVILVGLAPLRPAEFLNLRVTCQTRRSKTE
jgi:Bacteriophage tail sheath protein